jgi:hypothetical protein
VKRGTFNSVKIHAPYITYVPHITKHEKVNKNVEDLLTESITHVRAVHNGTCLEIPEVKRY